MVPRTNRHDEGVAACKCSLFSHTGKNVDHHGIGGYLIGGANGPLLASPTRSQFAGQGNLH